MTKPAEFRPEALEELDEAMQWFADERAGLAKQFRDAVHATVTLIIFAPTAWSPVPRVKGARAAKVKGFPYRVFYFEQPEAIRIMAIAHESRRPLYWKERLRE